MKNFKKNILWIAPVIAIFVMALMIANNWNFLSAFTIGITIICALWWIFEPIPIPVTSLIPLGAFPISGVLSGEQVASAYGNPLILLLMGGAMLSKAMERSGAHKRLAISMIRLFGGDNPKTLVLGFMVASAFLSMWVSNTATTLMLIPVIFAVLENSNLQKNNSNLAVALLLGVAYAASIGGLGTPIGSPPNVIFLKIYGDTVGAEPSFLQWMLWGLPVVLIMIPISCVWLTRNLPSSGEISIPKTGLWSSYEKRVLVTFAITALLWITLREPFGGWTTWFSLKGANYSSIALLAIVAMFIVPNGAEGKLLDWKAASDIQWGVLLLFAGGLAIAKSFETTGISFAIGESLSGVTKFSIILVVFITSICVTFLTEITSNTATTALLMPILAATAIGSEIDPMILMLPAALSASCAFMLPVATAPNAIVFGTEKIKVIRMVKEGFVLNLIGILVISSVVMFWLN